MLLRECNLSYDTFKRINSLLRLYAGVANDLAPARDLAPDIGRSLSRGVANRLVALLAELLQQIRGFKHAQGFGIEPRCHVARRAGRHHEPIPAHDIEPR